MYHIIKHTHDTNRFGDISYIFTNGAIELRIGILVTCGKHLYERITSLNGEVLVFKTIIMVPLFIEVFFTMIIIKYYNMIIIWCKTLLLYTLRFFTHTRRCYYTHSASVPTYKALLLYTQCYCSHIQDVAIIQTASVHTCKTLLLYT